MNSKSKQLSNPFSTGGGGAHFEAHIQASFVALMLTGGYVPCMPCWPIKEIKLQGKVDGFDTDDLIVFIEKSDTKEQRKLLGQVKHSIGLTKGNTAFSEVIQAAWNDFNNHRVFSKGKDIIALITGPLTTTDFHNVQWLLSQAKHTKNVDEFFRNVEQTNFSPPKCGEKLAAIQYHLMTANNNTDVSRDELYEFLNHFHLLGYDLGKEVGVILSLLHSHISQFNQQYPQWVWSRVVDVVQTWNQDAGTITAERLPEDLIEAFEQPAFAYIPEELVITQPEPEKTDWNHYQHAAEIALANLIGAWNERNEADISVLTQLLDENYSTWVPKAREILHLPDSPFSLKNGLWKITERADLWGLLGSRIFDQNLDSFKEAVIAVLIERDPSFELPTEERYAASIQGKVLTQSPALRKGLAEGLAVLGNNPGPSPTWKAFLNNHVRDLASIDFFVVPTVRNKVLFVLVVLAHHRRRVVHFNVTEHPTAQWTGQQIIEAFPWDTVPKYLLRDRDCIYGSQFQKRVQSMGIEEVLSAPRSPWQNAYVERVIGSIRRDCLDHVIVLNDRHLKRILTCYFKYYHRWRMHLSLGMDSPESRSVQSPVLGKVVQFPEVGGLHHHYERLAA